jgi:hypothetical protein
MWRLFIPRPQIEALSHDTRARRTAAGTFEMDAGEVDPYGYVIACDWLRVLRELLRQREGAIIRPSAVPRKST